METEEQNQWPKVQKISTRREKQTNAMLIDVVTANPTITLKFDQEEKLCQDRTPVMQRFKRKTTKSDASVSLCRSAAMLVKIRQKRCRYAAKTMRNKRDMWWVALQMIARGMDASH